MKLVIDISEKDIDFVRKTFKPTGYSFIPTQIQTEFVSAILNGIPLPKGHGRLIDADEIQFENAEFDTYGDYCRAFDAIEQAETIIEADKEADNE